MVGGKNWLLWLKKHFWSKKLEHLNFDGKSFIFEVIYLYVCNTKQYYTHKFRNVLITRDRYPIDGNGFCLCYPLSRLSRTFSIICSINWLKALNVIFLTIYFYIFIFKCAARRKRRALSLQRDYYDKVLKASRGPYLHIVPFNWPELS